MGAFDPAYNPPYQVSKSKPAAATQAPGYGAALAYYQGQYEPQQAYLDLQQTQQRNKIGQLYAANGLNGSQAGQNSQFANQDYSLGLQGLGVDRNNVGIDNDYYNSLQSLVNNDLSGSLGYQDIVGGLAQKLLGLQQGAVNQTYDTNRRNQISSTVATGGAQSLMNIKGLQDIYGVQQNQLGQLQQGYESTQAQIAEAKRNAQTSADRETLGIQHDLKLNDNQLAALDIKAKELGLSRDKALAGIQQGLAKMNLDTTLSVGDVLDAITSGDFQRQQIGEQIIREAQSAYGGGYFPDQNYGGSSSGSRSSDAGTGKSTSFTTLYTQ